MTAGRAGCALAALAGSFVACAAPRPRPATVSTGAPRASAPDAPLTDAQPVPSDLAAEVQRAVALGVELYVQDRVSALATDALLAHVADPAQAGVAGWITLRPPEEPGQPAGRFVTFFFTAEDPPRFAYRIDMAPKARARLQTLDPPATPTPALLEMVRARTTALVAARGRLRGPLNAVVLPARALGRAGHLVYVLRATTKPGLVVLGQHLRVWVADDGRQVKEVAALSQGDLELLVDGGPSAGSRAAGLAVTHLATPQPLETHVLASLQHKRLPLFVSTSRGLWKVEGDAIEYHGAPPAARR